MCDKLGSGSGSNRAIVSYRVKLALGDGVGHLLKLNQHLCSITIKKCFCVISTFLMYRI